ncbi:ComEC/Rec2 family competence protein [Seohaeicola saemankumensis]|uniref:ComEC/Rec2 family competence protein n=1 Tax=Seohaeicola TaxID=481178 RepID=UPI0035D139B0
MSSDAHSGGQELRITAALSRILATQRGALLPWAPVFLAIGIGAYFSLQTEPSVMLLSTLGGLALAGGWIASRLGPVSAPFLWALVLVAAGVALAGARAHQVAGPQIGWRYYGPIEGRIVGIDRSASDAVRIVLDRVVLRDIAPQDTPLRVRLSLHGDQDHLRPWPGQVVITTGHLSVSNGPVEPGSFDFRRHAWFLKLGAVGYVRSPVLLLRPPDGGQPVFTARMWLSARVQDSLPGEVGAFAAAVMAGDRSGMGQDTLEALRVSNLAHLLAISGLHMGLLTGFVFGLFRLILAAVPVVGLRVPAKKLSAALALVVAAGYLALSGGNVATERAFVMVAVVLVAVIFDRRALTLRAVAVAAMIILTLRPEALMGPGFQMSFAATTALVAVFAWIREAGLPRLPGWLKPVAAVVVSSGVAGLATAPLGAAHFNQFAHYGLIANLLSVPLMGALVMPAAVLAVCLLPFGLEGAALWIMGQGLGWILGVAHFVTGLEGARGTIVTPPAVVLPMMALGALVVMLWQGWGRIMGVPVVLAALLIWTGAQRPAILIAGDGGLVGVMTAQGRALSRASGAGFVAQNWLDHDADNAPQADAAARWPQTMPLFFSETGQLIHLRGKAAADPQCGPDDWLVMDRVAPPGLPCKVFDLRSLRGTGALAVMPRGDGYRILTVRDRTGARLWNTAPRTGRRADPDQ